MYRKFFSRVKRRHGKMGRKCRNPPIAEFFPARAAENLVFFALPFESGESEFGRFLDSKREGSQTDTTGTRVQTSFGAKRIFK